MKRIIYTAVSFGLIFLIQGCGRHEQARQSSSSSILVAAQDLSPGMILKDEHLQVSGRIHTKTPERFVQSTNLQQALGRKLLYYIKVGEPISWNDLENACAVK